MIRTNCVGKYSFSLVIVALKERTQLNCVDKHDNKTHVGKQNSFNLTFRMLQVKRILFSNMRFIVIFVNAMCVLFQLCLNKQRFQ